MKLEGGSYNPITQAGIFVKYVRVGDFISVPPPDNLDATHRNLVDEDNLDLTSDDKDAGFMGIYPEQVIISGNSRTLGIPDGNKRVVRSRTVQLVGEILPTMTVSELS